MLASVLALGTSVVGSYTLFIGNSKPLATLTLPVWQYGQFLMLFGLANVFVYACIFLQVRGLIRERDGNAV